MNSERGRDWVRVRRVWLSRCVVSLLVLLAWAFSGIPVIGQGTTYVVRPGDTLNLIAQTYGTTVDAIVRANGLTTPDVIWVGQTLIIPLAGTGTVTARAVLPGTVYTVKLGDTLAGIANAFGVQVADLIKANAIGNPDLLWVGQRLVIPGGALSSPAAQPTPRQPTPTVPSPVPTATPVPTDLSPASATSLPGAAPSAVPPTATPGLAVTALPSPTPTGLTPTALPSPSATPRAATPVPPKRYTVMPGDTLGQIAQRYGVTAAAIARANFLDTPDLIYVGMELVIPQGDTTGDLTSIRPSRFVVSISKQRCWLYQGNEIVADWKCSTGKPGTVTRPGVYAVQSKMERAYGSTWNIWMPYWLGIYWAGGSENGIHGIPYNATTGWRLWEGYVGTPVTYGCVLLDNVHAKMLYDVAYIGLPVIVQP